ncbi:MAG: GMC family oxidoreductase N-terminal domain-containing protein [Paracoccus sp. (in: a-proteobacteria)]
MLDDFARAAQAAGIPATDDFNTGDNEGVGYFKVNQRGGWRVSTAKAFLRPALGRPNLSVMTDVQVGRIRFQDRRAIVEILRKAAGIAK